MRNLPRKTQDRNKTQKEKQINENGWDFNLSSCDKGKNSVKIMKDYIYLDWKISLVILMF